MLLINIVLMTLVLLFLSALFPNIIIVSGIFAAIIAAVLIQLLSYIATIIFGTILIAITDAWTDINDDNVAFVSGFFLVAFIILTVLLITPLILKLISDCYSGFQIVGGFWTYFCLSIVIGIFQIKPKKD